MSGESPREEKCVDRNGEGSVADPNQFNTCDITVTVPATVPTQASKQQLIVRWPFGQQGSWDASECETAAAWQSVNINEEIPANATAELCNPMTSITMTAAN